jgi:hypothetical protein
VDGGIEHHTDGTEDNSGERVFLSGTAVFHAKGGVAAGIDALRAAV